MNVWVRRHGILIETLAIDGERARIGSSDTCEIRLNDPSLAPVVAEFAERGGEWRVVDVTALPDGLTYLGRRVEDQPVEPDQPYSVGAFEIVTDANPSRRSFTPTEVITTDAGMVPKTMFESPLPLDLAPTIIQDDLELPRRKRTEPGLGRKTAAKKLVIRHVIERSPAPSEPEKPVEARRPRSFVPFIVAGVIVIIAVAAVLRFRQSPPLPARTQPHVDTAALAAAKAAEGDQFARDLAFDKAIASWERAAAIHADPHLRAKIANGSLTLARIYAAANDADAAKRYFATAVRYGAPNSEQVVLAKRP